MANPTYKIQAVKPDGSPVVITGRQFNEISKVWKAMISNDYTSIRVFKTLTPDMLFIQEIIKETKCNAKSAMSVYKKIFKVMGKAGIEFTQRGAIHANS